MIHTTHSGTDVFGRVDDLHLSKGDRLRATGCLHDGELIAEFYCRARSGVETVAGSLAHAAKAMFESRARH